MKKTFMPKKDGIQLKKKHGQHFLKDETVLKKIVSYVKCSDQTPVFEIGGGQGALTREILKTSCKSLDVFEIDQDWAEYLQRTIQDKRLTVHHTNILDVNPEFFAHDKWILLANLPYHVTFPILHLLYRIRSQLIEGVIMVQEEVAQRVVATHGRDCGYVSVFFQWYFDWRLLDKILPGAFLPPPQVNSRLLYLKPRESTPPIPQEEQFWKMIKAAYRQPRRTLRNNLCTLHYDLSKIGDDVLNLRAQQMSIVDFLALWHKLIAG